MTVRRLGILTLGECVPIAASAVGAVLPEIQAKLAGALEAQARLAITPPTLAVSLDAAVALVAALEASIAIGLPALDFQVAGLIAVIAELQAQISILLALELTLGTPGIAAYAYEGPAAPLGSELQGAVDNDFGPTAPANALLLVATDAGAWAAMQTALRT